jgi:hypothetical protein
MVVFLLNTALAAPPAGFDHEHAVFDAVLDGATDGALVRYDVLAKRRSELGRYLASLEAAPVATFTKEQALAFWIDAYNAHTLATVLDAMPLKSILDLEGGQVWKKRTFLVAGERLTLDQIEHERIRKLGDGRVHAVVNCASKGCPPLPPDAIVAEELDRQLDAGVARWMATNAYRIEGSTVRLSTIFDWYGEDFAAAGKGDIPNADGEQEAALWWLAARADAPTAARLTGGQLTPAWMDYDWSLNAR